MEVRRGFISRIAYQGRTTTTIPLPTTNFRRDFICRIAYQGRNYHYHTTTACQFRKCFIGRIAYQGRATTTIPLPTTKWSKMGGPSCRFQFLSKRPQILPTQLKFLKNTALAKSSSPWSSSARSSSSSSSSSPPSPHPCCS